MQLAQVHRGLGMPRPVFLQGPDRLEVVLAHLQPLVAREAGGGFGIPPLGGVGKARVGIRGAADDGVHQVRHGFLLRGGLRQRKRVRAH